MKRLSPLKAIRKNCLDCSGGSPTEAGNCVIPECPLYEYRLGTNPRRLGVGRRRKAEFTDKPAVGMSEAGGDEIGAKTPSHEGGNEQGIDSGDPLQTTDEGYQHTIPAAIDAETPTQQATGDQGGALAKAS